MLLIVISIESAIVRNRDVESPAGSFQQIRRCYGAGGDLVGVVWAFL